MEQSLQMNMRISKQLNKDLEFIAQQKNISKSEWLKTKICEFVNEEKEKQMMSIERKYLSGWIDDIEFKKRMGFSPSNEMQSRRKSISMSPKEYMDDMVKKVKQQEKKTGKCLHGKVVKS